MKSKRICPHAIGLVLSYDGTLFSGWQMQQGQRTVQEELAKAIDVLIGHEGIARTPFAVSRTDAGVHAMGQIVAVSTNKDIQPRGWVHGLNSHLPSDINVRHAFVCPAGYNPRFDSKRKLYRYLLHYNWTPCPLLRDRVWHLGPPFARKDIRFQQRTKELESWVDLESMKQASKAWLGTHDFKAFRGKNDHRKNTVRTIESVEIIPAWQNNPSIVAIEISGTAFLKNMVRIMIGTLVEIGRKHCPTHHVSDLLQDKHSGLRAGPTAPPSGLYLVEVELGREQPSIPERMKVNPFIPKSISQNSD